MNKHGETIWIYSGKYIWEYHLKRAALIDFKTISETFPKLPMEPYNIDTAYTAPAHFTVLVKVSLMFSQ